MPTVVAARLSSGRGRQAQALAAAFALFLIGNSGERSEANVPPAISLKPTASPAPQTLGSTPAPPQSRAFVTLIVNGRSFANALIAIVSNDILVRVSDLQAAGVPVATGFRQSIAGADFFSLNSARGQLTYSLDQKALALNITLLNASLLGQSVINLGPTQPGNLRYVQDRGFFLNYALSVGTRAPLGGFFEAGLDFSHALLLSTFQATRTTFQRQVTQLIYDNRIKSRRTIVGEAPISTGNLGGGAVLAGASVQRKFDLNPYSVIFPTPTLQGSVLTPSHADVYVNGQLVRTIDLQPGDFTLTDIPAESGFSKTQVVIRDAFGNTKRLDTTFLTAAGLLRRGLSDYAFAAGLERSALLSGETGYRQLAFAGRFSVGVSDKMTVGSRLEATPNLISTGISLARVLGPAFISAAVAQSLASGLPGSAASVSVSLPNRKVGASAFVNALSPHYATLGLKPGDPRDPLMYGGSLGFSLGRLGAVSVSQSNALTPAHEVLRSTTISFQKSIARGIGLFVGFNHSIGGKLVSGDIANTSALSIGLVAQLHQNSSFTLSRNTTASQGVVQSGTSLGFARANQSPFGLSYSGQINPGKGGSEGLSVLYRGRGNNIQTDIFRDTSGTTANFSLGGALAFMGGHFFATRPIADAFGLVVAPTLKGADVFANGRYEGRTNRSGFLLVPDLTSGSPNKVTLTPTKASFNQTFSQNSDYIVPSTRGAAFFRYNVTTVHAILGTIAFQQKDGRTIVPLFGEVTMNIDGREQKSEIDETGRFYFDSVQAGHYTALVAFKDQTCEVTFTVPSRTQIVLQIGTLTCVAH